MVTSHIDTFAPHVPRSPALAAAVTLARAFAAHGEELFLVGGAVRGVLMPDPITELDFATSARPPRILEIIAPFAEAGPYRIGEKFGTIGSRIAGLPVEITTYRSAEWYAQGDRKPDVEFGDSVAHDLGRRDFTMNAIAWDPLKDVLLDPYNGARDIQEKQIRAVGDAAARFIEDPLRLLRAARFAARFDFAIEPSTWDAMRETARTVALISRERVRDEYSKILVGPHPDRGLQLLLDSRVMEHAVPGLLPLASMPDHGPRHTLSLWEHTLRVVRGVPNTPTVRWAALLHDIGKPSTRTTEANGRIRFFHHEEVGASLARAILTDLRFAKTFVESVTALVSAHMQVHAYTPEWSDGAVRRLVLRMGDLVPDLIALARADGAGHSESGISANSGRLDELETRVARLGDAELAPLRSPLSGEDLMEHYAYPPGPWIREVKQVLLDAVLDGTLSPSDRSAAFALADTTLRRGGQRRD